MQTPNHQATKFLKILPKNIVSWCLRLHCLPVQACTGLRPLQSRVPQVLVRQYRTVRAANTGGTPVLGSR